MKNIHKPLTKGILILLGLTVVATSKDAVVQEKSLLWNHSFQNFK